jgi:hypothetical protein
MPCRYHPFLKTLVLLLDRLFQPSYLGLLILDFIQQHGVEHLILYRLDLPVGGAGDRVGVDFGDLFGDESVLKWLGAIVERLFVAEGDGAQAHQPIARVGDVVDVFFESPGGADGSRDDSRISEVASRRKLKDLQKASGWQPLSVRGFLSGSSGTGLYSAPNVLVGTYKLPIKALGFSTVLHALKACARALGREAKPDIGYDWRDAGSTPTETRGGVRSLVGRQLSSARA